MLTKEIVSMYLPYDVKFQCEEGIGTIGGLYTKGGRPIMCHDLVQSDWDYKDLKLILHPLSDLKKLNNIDSKTVQIQLLELNNDVSIISYQLHSWLCENHFDVSGLIEKGSAIDKKEVQNDK